MKRRDDARLLTNKEQKPCDDGLFSDEGKQLKLAIPADLSIPEFLRRAA
jgi:hypothetical protein